MKRCTKCLRVVEEVPSAQYALAPAHLRAFADAMIKRAIDVDIEGTTELLAQDVEDIEHQPGVDPDALAHRRASLELATALRDFARTAWKLGARPQRIG